MIGPDAELEQRCAMLVDRLRSRHGWALIERAEFVARVLRAAHGQPGVALPYLAFGVYNHALYAACSGAEGHERQDQGYAELFRTLSAAARQRFPDVAEEAAQLAVEHTYTRIARCAEPRAFFTFAWQQLLSAARGLRRREQRRALSLQRVVGEDETRLGDLLEDPRADLVAQLLTDELCAELRAVLAEIARASPRAARQIAAVRLKYIEGMEDQSIAAALGVPVKRVHELRSLGLKKLRADPRWRTLLAPE